MAVHPTAHSQSRSARREAAHLSEAMREAGLSEGKAGGGHTLDSDGLLALPRRLASRRSGRRRQPPKPNSRRTLTMISDRICLRVKGPFACFTRPEFHVE